MWLSGLSARLQTERSQVRFPVRAHAWVVGQVPSWGCVRDSWSVYFSPSLSPSLPLFLKINKVFFFNKKDSIWKYLKVKCHCACNSFLNVAKCPSCDSKGRMLIKLFYFSLRYNMGGSRVHYLTLHFFIWAVFPPGTVFPFTLLCPELTAVVRFREADPDSATFKRLWGLWNGASFFWASVSSFVKEES